MAKPLRQIQNMMLKVGEGNLDLTYQKDRFGCEINQLGDSFNDMLGELKHSLQREEEEKLAKELYAKELEIAKEIQQSILPLHLVDFPGLDIAVFFAPAKEVAGDFYDWQVTDHCIHLVIADGVGKGTMGCLYSLDLRSILRAYWSKSNDLKQIVSETNQLFCTDTKDTGSFVTAFIASFDKESSELSYVNCGHNHPIVKKKDGKVDQLIASGMPFGIEQQTPLSLEKITLEPGDLVIFFTDGITDAQNRDGELFSEERLISFVEKHHAETTKGWINAIISEVETFVNDANQYDDMTLLIFKMN